MKKTSLHLLHPTRLVLLLLLALVQPLTAEEDRYVGAPEPRTATAIYGQGVRDTEWRSPEEQRAGFHLPPGFEIELVASEPQIDKPLNMAWDQRGRLWISSTVEYPYPAADDAAARDSIRILEDTDGDGRADSVTTFADQLNIPMGLLPVADGVICFSIPYLWYLRDTDGDDVCDQRIRLLGPFDTTRDTHGMINSLRQGDDGWIYACHGFNNQSRVTATDGSSVELISGNTFRFRPDGSRIEKYTQGQVNPFGMTADEFGNWYTADCHSKPLTALLPGACYPSFGRPHDGLGFAPSMMDHLHGSTAISGLQYYQANHFPAPYRRLFYSGNVMTSRINCNALEWQGATTKAREQADFLTSDDPWFRPVDIQLGPDGALYVADFYNKIIGHYEVPLEHPERDRTSGRIWRIVYHGSQSHEVLQAPSVGSELSPSVSLASTLSSSNNTRAALAVELALQRPELLSDEAAIAYIQSDEADENLRIRCLEVLHRRGALKLNTIRLDPEHPHQRFLVLFLRLAAEYGESEHVAELRRHVGSLLPLRVPQANLVACRLMAHSKRVEDARRIVKLIIASESDAALVHAGRIALRDMLRNDQLLQELTANWTSASVSGTGEQTAASVVASVLPAVSSELAAERLLVYVQGHEEAEESLVDQAIEASVQYPHDRMISRLLEVVSRRYANNLVTLAERYVNLCNVYRAANAKLSPQLIDFGRGLRKRLAQRLERDVQAAGLMLDWSDQGGQDWGVESRRLVRGGQAELRSSLTRGENYVGTLRSEVFTCPDELSFQLAGHNGPPNFDDQKRNFVFLEDAITGQALVDAFPPRNDRASEIAWDLNVYAGKLVRFSIRDGVAGNAYAWLAVGDFSEPSLNVAGYQPLLRAYMDTLRLDADVQDRETIAELPLSGRQQARLVAVTLIGSGATITGQLAEEAIAFSQERLITLELLEGDPEKLAQNIAEQLSAAITTVQQRSLVDQLSQSAAGCRLLEHLLRNGKLSLQSLRDAEPLLPQSLEPATAQFLHEQFELAKELAPAATDVDERLSQLDWSTADRQIGEQLYRQHCSVCHQLGGEGKLVGPQLDGAIVRGAERLAEDILAPNVNVDKAFRVSALLLDDDSVLTGLVVETEGGSLQVTGQDGKSQSLSEERIVGRRDSSNSLMPSNFGELLSDQQLASLLEFLGAAAAKELPQ